MNRTHLAAMCIVFALSSNAFAQTFGHSSDFKIRKILQVAKAPSPSPIERIATVVAVKPHVGGTFVDIEFSTNVDVVALVNLSSGSTPLPNGAVAKKTTPMGKTHRVTFVNLRPDTRHRVHIDVLPAASSTTLSSPTAFEITTLQRFAFVAVQTINVFDDADATTAGDMSFTVQIGDEHGNFNEPGNSWDFLEFRADLNSHTALNVPASGKAYFLKGENIRSDTLKVAVSNFESDNSGIRGINFILGPDIYLGSGESSSGEWNSGFTTINIAGSYLSPNEQTLQKSEALVKTFEIIVPPSAETPLSYSMTGQLVVAYY